MTGIPYENKYHEKIQWGKEYEVKDCCNNEIGVAKLNVKGKECQIM